MSVGPYEQLVTHVPPQSPAQLRKQRVTLMQQIQAKRGRPLVVYATDGSRSIPGLPNYMHRDDLVPLSEILSSISGNAVDVLLETPGGFAEVTIEIVNLLRPRFDHVAFIVPHMAMSAGTILVMSGDEILMDHRSSLGAIDPQFIGADGRPQPAQALLTGIDAVKDEVDKNKGVLHPVYMPILRNVDPGKLQSARNASALSRQLVTEWLPKYKFRTWVTHSSTNAPVTDDDRTQRASEIAHALCDHQSWLSHSRPIKIPELERMKLKITNYGADAALQALIWDLWVNVHHLLGSTNIYKLFESEKAALYKIAVQQQQQAPAIPPPQQGKGAGHAIVDVKCNTCGTLHKVQINFGSVQPPMPGAVPLPSNCLITCKGCNSSLNLSGLKLNVEQQTGQPAVF